jgi:hypothetical protein
MWINGRPGINSNYPVAPLKKMHLAEFVVLHFLSKEFYYLFHISVRANIRSIT